MIGGMIWPPEAAAASTAPANCAGYPCRFIIGMVMAPVVATLATALPLIMPMMPLAITATCAAPPLTRPAAISARFRKADAPPVASRIDPKST